MSGIPQARRMDPDQILREALGWTDEQMRAAEAELRTEGRTAEADAIQTMIRNQT